MKQLLNTVNVTTTKNLNSNDYTLIIRFDGTRFTFAAEYKNPMSTQLNRNVDIQTEQWKIATWLKFVWKFGRNVCLYLPSELKTLLNQFQRKDMFEICLKKRQIEVIGNTMT